MTSERHTSFSYIDLFSGIGGFRLALDAEGGNCLQFSEINKDAIETYCKNFDESPNLNLGDIRSVKNLPPHDLLTAGVPCQSWSIAGKNLGFNDDRGQLWNDGIYLLKSARPKAFIFENVKGLADPRNKEALTYILNSIQQAGYSAKSFLLNSFDFGLPQDRVRLYIVGFLDHSFAKKFSPPSPQSCKKFLGDFLIDYQKDCDNHQTDTDLFGFTNHRRDRSRRVSSTEDFFLFNDIRNGQSTIHSWDLFKTTHRQKEICLLLLKNRRKSIYGKLDGNPLSLLHLQALDSTIREAECDELVELRILKKVPFRVEAQTSTSSSLSQTENFVLSQIVSGLQTIDTLRESPSLKAQGINPDRALSSLLEKNLLACTEYRYEFRYTKISTGIEGINRVFLPRSPVFPTLVASDTNDFVALKNVSASNPNLLRSKFLNEIFEPGLYRKINRQEACLIQGFPPDFILPESRSRWMRLIGNSVSVPVIRALVKAIKATGCFDSDHNTISGTPDDFIDPVKRYAQSGISEVSYHQ